MLINLVNTLMLHWDTSKTITDKHKKNFDFIKKNNIIAGKTRVIDGHYREVLIKSIHPSGGWLWNGECMVMIEEIKEVIN